MQYQKFIIDKNYKNIYYFLKTNGFSERYMSFLRKELGYIKKNGTPVTIKADLKPEDTLEVVADTTTKSSIMQCILPLDIVFEDDYYLIVNKTSGLASIPTKSHYTENLSGAVAHYLSSTLSNFTLRVINRLDKDTAGIVIFAKSLFASNQLKNIEKTYYAICEGIIDTPITINKPIETINENGINQRKRVISENGKEAITYITPIKTFKNYSLVKLNLVHGRTHQIRVHLSSIEHPLLGDSLYGKASELISHTALLCKKITFFHPVEKKKIELEVDFPEDFKKLLKNM